MKTYNQLKGRGISEDDIKGLMKYKFIENKNLFYAACAQGQQHLNDVSQQLIDTKSLIDTFTNKPGNDIYKPYFNVTDKYESEETLDKEEAFIEIAQQVLDMYRNLKSDNAKKYNDDVSKCVDILNEIINPTPSLAEWIISLFKI